MTNADPIIITGCALLMLGASLLAAVYAGWL